jgi:hypothetical protein
MGLLGLIEKIEALKVFVSSAVPDALDRTADVMDKASAALRDAADYLRGPLPIQADGTAEAEADRRLAAIEADLSNPRFSLGGMDWLGPLLLELIRAIRKKRAA